MGAEELRCSRVADPGSALPCCHGQASVRPVTGWRLACLLVSGNVDVASASENPSWYGRQGTGKRASWQASGWRPCR